MKVGVVLKGVTIAFVLLVGTMGVVVCSQASDAQGVKRSAAIAPPVFRKGNVDSILSGIKSKDDEVFWDAQDFQGISKVSFNFLTAPAVGQPAPGILIIGVEPNGSAFALTEKGRFQVTDNPPKISSRFASVVWVPSARSYHLTANLGSGFKADLWFKGHPGAGMLGMDWDGQSVSWVQAIGAGRANGTVTFPNSKQSTTITNWGGEEETEYGTYEIFPASIHSKVIHIGYDYTQSDNPDGSEDALNAYPEKGGGWQGVLVHTSAEGKVTECLPKVQLLNWHKDPSTGFDYPLTITAECGTLSMSWQTSTLESEVYPLAEGFLVSDGIGESSVPGSVAVVQDLRDRGYFGQVPAG